MTWHPSQYLDDDGWGILDDDNCIIVGLSSRITKETAQTICRAVNSHAELVAALEAMMPEGWDDGTMDHMPGIGQARAALAKVKR